MRHDQIKTRLIRSVLVAVCLIAAYLFQSRFLAMFDHDDRISLFYTPAAVITLSALTLRYHAALGIFLGYVSINLFQFGHDIPDALLLSLAPPLVTIATIAILSTASRRIGNFFKPNATLIEIDAFDILLFCAGYGLVNASLHHVLFYFDGKIGTSVSISTMLKMMFGDLTGSFLGFIILNLAYSLVTRLICLGRRGNRAV